MNDQVVATLPANVIPFESRQSRAADVLSGLTRREREVAIRLAAGLSYKEIASELAISAHTVNSHVKAILKKLGLSGSRRLAALLYQS